MSSSVVFRAFASDYDCRHLSQPHETPLQAHRAESLLLTRSDDVVRSFEARILCHFSWFFSLFFCQTAFLSHAPDWLRRISSFRKCKENAIHHLTPNPPSLPLVFHQTSDMAEAPSPALASAATEDTRATSAANKASDTVKAASAGSDRPRSKKYRRQRDKIFHDW